jgi:hypothetical protein
MKRKLKIAAIVLGIFWAAVVFAFTLWTMILKAFYGIRIRLARMSRPRNRMRRLFVFGR